jgi:RNA 2',3'-cyclic 3'-phosphodiesterase
MDPRDQNDPVRTFVAIDPSAAQRAALDEVVARVARRLAEVRGAAPPDADPVRWTPTDQAHLTLAFLGHVERWRLGAIRERLTDVAAQRAPFALGLGDVGAFPDVARPRVVWVGIREGAEATIALASEVRRALEPLGFDLPSEPFRPHLTLGRVRRSAGADDRRALAHVLASEPAAGDDTVVTTVRELTLVASRVGAAGATHTVMHRWPLGRDGAA